MVSVVKVKHDEVAAGPRAAAVPLRPPDVADGEQRRDFIWVGDVVDVMLWLLDTPAVNGLFNLGTGRARSYLDLAHAVCAAAGRGARGWNSSTCRRRCAASTSTSPQARDGAAARGRLRGAVHAAGGRRARATCRTICTQRRSVPLMLPLMLPVLIFPQFDPVLVQLGPLADPLVRAGLHRRPA